jgi:hypothetical protein
LNPHRTRNHGSREHRESIKRMLDKTKKDNRVKVLRGQLQKMAIDYKTNWKTHGADMDAIRAFKSKEVYSSGENHPSGSKFKFRTDGKSLFLHDYEVARHHKDGIEISNAGYDSPLTYKTHQALGINSKGHAKHPKGLITLGTKEIDKNSGEWVLVNHADISEEPIIPDAMRKNQKARADGTFVERKKPKRETAEQASFRKRATKKELKEQGRKGGKPLSKVNIQKTDQRIIDAISGLKKSLPTDKRGQAAHHLLEYSGDGDIGKKLGLNKKDNDDENNSIMLPHDYHDFISHYNTSSPKTNLDNLRQMDSKIRQLKGKLQKIATINKNALGNNTMEEIGSYDWNTGKKLSIEQIHALGNGSDVFAVAVTKGLNKNSDFRVPEEYINKDFGVKKIGLVKGIYENEEGLIEHDRTYLFHGSDDEVQRQLNLHNDINKGVTQEAAGRIYKDKKGIVQYENIPNKQFKKTK